MQAELIDLRDWPLPFFNEAGSPGMLKGNYTNDLAKRWSAKIAEADAFIVVTPEYNHGYPAVLKNAFDWLYPEWNHKPIGFAGYGNANGARAIEQLRQVVIELQMHPIKNSVHIPVDIFITAMMNKDAAMDNAELFKPLRQTRGVDRMKIFFDELIGLTRTLKGVNEARPV